MGSMQHFKLAQAKLRSIERHNKEALDALRPVIAETLATLEAVNDCLCFNTHNEGNKILKHSAAAAFCALFSKERRRDSTTVDAANVLGVFLNELFVQEMTGWRKERVSSKFRTTHTVYVFALTDRVERPTIDDFRPVGVTS